MVNLIPEIKKELFCVLKGVLTVIVCAFAGMLLLMCVNLLPSGPIAKHAGEVMPYLGESWNDGDRWAELDGFTDNLMMNIAAFPQNEGLVRRTLLAPYADFYGGADARSHLSDLVNGREITDEYTTYYARYWHGYLILLRPLLSFINYGNIRELNSVLQFFLIFYIMHKLVVLYGVPHAMALFSVFLCINPVSSMLCMQFSSITFILIISVIVLLHNREKKPEKTDLHVLYLMCGIMAAFFDLLTFPVVSLGTLLVTELVTDENVLPVFKRLVSIVRNSIYWCVGYFGMWSAKFVFVGLFTDYDIWLDVKANAYKRIMGDELDLSLFNVISSNAEILYGSMIFKIIILVFLITVIFMIVFDKKSSFKKVPALLKAPAWLVPYLFIALYPFVWYAVLRNHSLTHSFLSFRDLSVTGYALFAVMISGLKTIQNKG